jgi:hypothetical protein
MRVQVEARLTVLELDPRETAALVIDMQRGISVPRGPGGRLFRIRWMKKVCLFREKPFCTSKNVAVVTPNSFKTPCRRAS